MACLEEEDEHAEATKALPPFDRQRLGGRRGAAVEGVPGAKRVAVEGVAVAPLHTSSPSCPRELRK